MTDQTDPVAEAITEYWGPRCPDHDDTCPTCKAWEAFDRRPAPTPAEPVAHYRHVKRGTTYAVVGIAELQSEYAIREGAHLTVYCGTDGKLWARPEDEFDDGRFEPVDHFEDTREMVAAPPAPDALREALEWQPIETAPRDGTTVDLWCINHLHYNKPGVRTVNMKHGPCVDWMGRKYQGWGLGENYEPTHWMPLPAPPQALAQPKESSNG